MHRVLRGFINISALWAVAAGAFGLITYYLWVWWVTGMPPHDVPLLWVGRYVLITAAIGAMMGGAFGGHHPIGAAAVAHNREGHSRRVAGGSVHLCHRSGRVARPHRRRRA